MPKSVLLVESRPESPQVVDDYNTWHDDVHIPEMLTIDGFSSARRWQADDGNCLILASNHLVPLDVRYSG
jgi:hypothetical protein